MLRIPFPDAAAPVSFTDDFNRADETLETSANWTRRVGAAGNMSVNGNNVFGNSGANGAYTCPLTLPTNHYTQGTPPLIGVLGIMVDYIDANNYTFFTSFDNGDGTRSPRVFNMVSGTLTGGASDTTFFIAANTPIRIESSGSFHSVVGGDIYVRAHPTATQNGLAQAASNPCFLTSFSSGSL